MNKRARRPCLAFLPVLVLTCQATASVPVMDARDPFFERLSTAKVGAKGEETLDVSRDPCRGEPLAFDHAELLVVDSRFGDAQFVSIPKAGCFSCDPLVVRWYHEPTGRLHFQVRVFRRPADVDCPVEPQP